MKPRAPGSTQASIRAVFPRLILAILLLFFYSRNLAADEISLALRSMAPYVSVDAAGTISGIEYEIIRDALAASGHAVKAEIYPLARVIAMAKAGNVMAAAPVQESHRTGRFLSDVYITYDNVALSLASSGVSLTRLSDLSGLRVLAFQRAKAALGRNFANAVELNPQYDEISDQVAQVRMLYIGRTDVIVVDRKIFDAIVNDPAYGFDSSVPVNEWRLFPKTEYRVAFLLERHRDDFNAGLARLRKDGRYDAIMKRYSPAK
jgi:polar amino acid transport system substrate-binding protein